IHTIVDQQARPVTSSYLAELNRELIQRLPLQIFFPHLHGAHAAVECGTNDVEERPTRSLPAISNEIEAEVNQADGVLGGWLADKTSRANTADGELDHLQASLLSLPTTRVFLLTDSTRWRRVSSQCVRQGRLFF